MSLELLLPVEEIAVAHAALQSDLTLGRKIRIHTKKHGLPNLDKVQIALIGVPEGRGAVDNVGTGKGLEIIRKYLYQLFPGNWHVQVADLGNVPAGSETGDTYFLVQEILGELLEQHITPVIIGGSQDITYANYRAYDRLGKPVNIVSIDNCFDIGEMDPKLNSRNYLHYIVMDKPNNLFNFSNIGFQTFFNSQEEIDLMDKLFFEAYRLGEVTSDIKAVEPVLRDAEIVSIDLGAVRMSDAPANSNSVPNGFYGDQICAISRYAGISSKVSSFGIYEYNPKFDQRDNSAHLIAQMIWYFIEGYHLRIEEYPLESSKSWKKYIVPVEEQTINFFKSSKSERWWMEVEFSHNNMDKSTLIPCTYQDYLSANNQILPERWLKTFRKLN